MSPLNALNRLLAIQNIANADVTLSLATFIDGNIPEFRSINISEDVGIEFCEIATRFLVDYSRYAENGDLRLHEFSGGYRPESHEIEYILLDEHQIGATINAIPQATDIQLIDVNDGFINNVRFYMIQLSCQGHNIMLFRRYGRSKELTRSNKLYIKLMGERYERLREPTFQFDDSFDVIIYNNMLYSFNKHNFQHIFRFYEMMRDSAEECLHVIRASIPIANFARFEANCLTHLQKLAKLRNIASKPYLARVTMDDLRRTINRFGLPIHIINENGEDKLDYNDEDKWVILNLLDDAYLGSEMTGIMYEANSKREM